MKLDPIDPATIPPGVEVRFVAQMRLNLDPLRYDWDEARGEYVRKTCILDCDSPSFPPGDDERRQCGCESCLSTLMQNQPENPATVSEVDRPVDIAGDQTPILNEISADKQLRVDLDAALQRLKGLPPTRERSLTITKVQEAIMWLGMDLKRIHEQTGVGANPYPQSYNPASPVIEKTADGLKL